MELPVAPQSHAPAPDALVRAIQRGDMDLARMAAEEAELDGAVAFINPRRPGIYMLNFAGEVRVPAGAAPGSVLAQIADHFRAAGTRCWSLRPPGATWPADLATAIEQAGYQPVPVPIFALQHYQRPDRLNEQLQIVPSRAAGAEAQRLCRRVAIDRYHVDETIATHLAQSHADFLDEPRLEAYLGRLAGTPAGMVEVLGLGDLGIITNLSADPAHRRQRVATTLLAHALDYCARAAFRAVILETDEGNPAIKLYEALGFRRAAGYVRYQLAP
jgi:ribosomal protein S18 acetylase RimI-like enzyme